MSSSSHGRDARATRMAHPRLGRDRYIAPFAMCANRKSVPGCIWYAHRSHISIWTKEGDQLSTDLPPDNCTSGNESSPRVDAHPRPKDLIDLIGISR